MGDDTLIIGTSGRYEFKNKGIDVFLESLNRLNRDKNLHKNVLDVYKRQDEEGNDIPVTMIQRWPVKRAMTNYKEKPRPFKLLETGVRVICLLYTSIKASDTMFFFICN